MKLVAWPRRQPPRRTCCGPCRRESTPGQSHVLSTLDAIPNMANAQLQSHPARLVKRMLGRRAKSSALHQAMSLTDSAPRGGGELNIREVLWAIGKERTFRLSCLNLLLSALLFSPFPTSDSNFHQKTPLPSVSRTFLLCHHGHLREL